MCTSVAENTPAASPHVCGEPFLDGLTCERPPGHLGGHAILRHPLRTRRDPVADEAPDVHDDPSWSPESAARFGAEAVEQLREWVIENEYVPDAEFRCSKRSAMALLDWADGLFRDFDPVKP